MHYRVVHLKIKVIVHFSLNNFMIIQLRATECFTASILMKMKILLYTHAFEITTKQLQLNVDNSILIHAFQIKTFEYITRFFN